MVHTHDIRVHVERYLAGALSLRDLVIWLAAEGWELRERSAPGTTALDFIRSFDAVIGEYSGHHITRDRLDERLRDILDTFPRVETTLTTISEPTRQSSTSAHTQYAEVFA